MVQFSTRHSKHIFVLFIVEICSPHTRYWKFSW